MAKPLIGGSSPEDDALLSKIMHQARIYDSKISEDFGNREHEIDILEDEIIVEYSNPEKLKFGAIADPIKCQTIFVASTHMLGRITEIYNNSLKNQAKLKATRQTILDGLLPLMQGGSADMREAKARGCTETINRLIALEEGLTQICESAQKNIKSAQEMASRALKAIELELVYFEGKEAMTQIVNTSRKRYYEGNNV